MRRFAHKEGLVGPAKLTEQSIRGGPIEALEAVPAHLQTAVVPWADEPLVEVDFMGHLHDEHVAPVRAWLDGASVPAPPDRHALQS